MKTTQEMIEVMQAYAEGKQIEYAERHFVNKSWILTKDPVWNWYENDYRIKPKPKYVPFTFEDAEFLMDKIVIQKTEKCIERLTQFNDDYANSFTYDELLSDFTFKDGSPCGKLKQ